MKAPSDSTPPQPSMSVPSEQPQTAEVPALRIDWNGWLDTVQALPSEAPDWEGIPRFLEGLQQLYEKNQQEREEQNSQRRRLQTVLSNLATQAGEMLKFFEIQDISQWTVEACPPLHITTAIQLSEKLLPLLLEHHEQNQRPAATHAENRLRWQKIDELGTEITGIHERLAELFTTSLEQPSQQQKPEEHQTEAEPPRTSPPPFPETPDAPPPLSPPEEAPHQEASALSPEIEPTDSWTDESALPLAVADSPDPAPPEPTPPIAEPQQEPPTDRAGQEPIASNEETPKLVQEKQSGEDNESAPPSLQIDESRTTEVADHDLPLPDLGPEQSAQREAPDPPAFVPPEVSDSDILLPGGRNSDIQEKAFHLQTPSDPEEWTNLLWALVAEDALPTAYWLTRSLPAMNQPCPVPDWLLAAVQSARWLLADSQTFVIDLTDAVQKAQPFEDEPQKLLGLSAALRATLLAPSTEIQTWLSVPECCPSLREIVEAIKNFSNWRRPLRPDDLLGGTAVEQRKEALREATQKAKAWLADAPQRRATLRRASAVWLNMTSQGGPLQAFLLPVAEDDQKKLDEVRKKLKLWQDRNYVTSRIDEIDKELAGKKDRRIDGKVRNRIVQDVREACDLARDWCEYVEREQDMQSGGDRFSRATNEVRSQIHKAIPEVIRSLKKLSNLDHPQSIHAAARCLLRSIEQLRDMFTVQPQPLTRQQQWFTANTDSLPAVLGRLLLWLPNIPLEDDGQVVEANLPQIAPALCNAIAEGRSLQTAFDAWLDRQDYRFIETMLDAFDGEDFPDRVRTHQEALEGSREGLRIALSETRDAIERAVVDGINVEERSVHEGIVESIVPDEILHFAPRYEQLNQINAQLEKASRTRLQEVQTDWDQLQPQLGNQDDPAKWERIRAFVQSNLDRKETRVVEECIAHLTEVVEEGGKLEEELFSPPDSRDVLQEFLSAMPLLENWLQQDRLHQVIDAIKRGRSGADIRFGETSTIRRNEAAQAIEAWRRLKHPRANGTIIPESVTTLLRYLGFSLKSEPNLFVPNDQQGTDWVHIQAQMSASDLAKPIPQFGSQTHGRYDIVCMWERPGADTMGAWLRDLHLDAQSVLVFYLGRLTVRQRRDFSQRARNQELISAVLDETLLVFLAQEHNSRLPIFLRCTLPFSAANPYTPFQAGDVPPEMFFGRDQMVRELQRSSGSCLVYGGRQLGKSALLQHVRREFHHPEREQYAWVEDIKLLGDPQADSLPESLWGRVREGLKELKLLPRQITTDKPEAVIRHVREVMTARPERRILVLFDEADNFLDADAKDRFQVVERLRTLMLATGRRFKVIFAGLHNVQRFQGIPNQPLAQFGTPLLVGPLEPAAAQQLVREPLEVLGYRFNDVGTVLRILSYTNYHPGLIQLFCQGILKRLHSRQQNRSLPYPITQGDVEAVYLLPQVRQSIRERFDWTLALDSRYQAIVWSMVLDQIDRQDGYAQAYAPTDLLQLARSWWPKGFNKVDSDQLRGLLDEMTGLGVLVRYANGHYRLRSPNLVRLIGTEADIENYLLVLSEKEPETPFDADSHHALLDEQRQRYSPLTHAQERRLNAAQFGVGLVFAHDALGLSSIEASFQRFVPADLPQGAKGDFRGIPSTVINSAGLEQWLKSYIASHKKYGRLVLYCLLRGKNAPLLETVKIAHKVCQIHQRSKTRWMRIFFVFDPEATWNWLSLPRQQRQDIEEQADIVTFPRRWNLLGIRQRLRQQDKMDSDEVCRAVLEATGGWPWLLDILFERCDTEDDLRSAAETIKQDLQSPNSRLFQDFKRSLGLHEIAYRILEFIKRQGDGEEEFPVEFIAPELIEGLSQDECRTALDYLQRTGCIELRGDLLSIEPTVLCLV